MDRLAHLLEHFSLHAGVFYAGNICGIQDFPATAARGHIHLIRRGPVQIVGVLNELIVISEPSLLFLPRPHRHRMITDDLAGADVVCGTVQFGAGNSNPINNSLPSIVLIKFAELDQLEALFGLIFEEAFAARSARQAVLDRLCEVLMIQVLRYCVEQGLTQGGTLAGLADTRLSKAITAIHSDPAKGWKLSSMAALAGMSRARFAVKFKQTTGETPADYLASWRVTTAQGMLRKGRPLKHVAVDVGYGSTSALTRAFVRKLGCSPTEWIKGLQEAGVS
jgi:AraC-like DNA-binding protein